MSETSTLPEMELTEDECHALRMAALEWSGGRGGEESLYRVALALIRRHSDGAPAKYVCATCRTAWTGDIQACPTCTEGDL